MSTLTATQLSKTYGAVVQNLSLEINTGEVVGLLGPNGAGKTTAFYMIVGLVKADSGNIRLDQQDLTTLGIDQRARLGLGCLPQEASVFRRLTAAENILAILELVPKIDRTERQRRCKELLGRASATCATRSACPRHGERRRPRLRARRGRAALHLADEPFAGSTCWRSPTSSNNSGSGRPRHRRVHH